MEIPYIFAQFPLKKQFIKIKQRAYVTLSKDNRFEPTPLGISLVDGYKRIGIPDFGYEMDKPELRANLELELMKICDGN